MVNKTGCLTTSFIYSVSFSPWNYQDILQSYHDNKKEEERNDPTLLSVPYWLAATTGYNMCRAHYCIIQPVHIHALLCKGNTQEDYHVRLGAYILYVS